MKKVHQSLEEYMKETIKEQRSVYRKRIVKVKDLSDDKSEDISERTTNWCHHENERIMAGKGREFRR